MKTKLKTTEDLQRQLLSSIRLEAELERMGWPQDAKHFATRTRETIRELQKGAAQ